MKLETVAMHGTINRVPMFDGTGQPPVWMPLLLELTCVFDGMMMRVYMLRFGKISFTGKNKETKIMC